MIQSDSELINKLVIDAQNGDQDAMEKLLRKLMPFRYAIARKYSNKGVDFDDIAQQIDLKLIEAVYDYEESKDPSALRHLTSRVKNGIWNFYRKEMNYFNKDKKTISLDEVRFKGEDESNEIVFNIHSRLIDSRAFNEDEILDRITMEEELDKLTPHQREVMLMCFVDDMTQYDIAESLQINQSNVSRAKKRGIQTIKEGINPSDEQSDNS